MSKINQLVELVLNLFELWYRIEPIWQSIWCLINAM